MHNLKTEACSVFHAFKEMRERNNANNGTRCFSFKAIDCHDQPALFTASPYSQISLMHPDHFVSDIDKGFLTFHAKLVFSLNTDMSKMKQIDEINKLYKLFVGFKSSNQLSVRLKILHNNINLGYQQIE